MNLYLDLNKSLKTDKEDKEAEDQKEIEKGKRGLGAQHRSSQKIAQQRAMWAFLSSIGHGNKKTDVKKPVKITVKKIDKVKGADVSKHNVGKALEDINMLMAKSVLTGKSQIVPVEPTEKALTAAFVPRIPKALRDDTYRSATAVMTRDNTRFAKDIHIGPLDDEMINELRETEAQRTRQLPMYKSCTGCGRTFMAKSADAGCPSCSVNKSQYCSCGSHLVKSKGGISCPLCG